MREIVRICLAASRAERSEGESFIERTYRETFGTAPPPSHYLIVAKRGCDVVGTVGIDTCDEGKALRLESLYSFDEKRSPLPYERDKIMEYGRWISSIPRISGPLLFAASTLALNMGKEYGWCEHTQDVHRITLRLGIAFYEVPGARLHVDQIPASDRTFYENASKSRLYMVSVRQVRESTRKATEHLVESGYLQLGPELH